MKKNIIVIGIVVVIVIVSFLILVLSFKRVTPAANNIGQIFPFQFVPVVDTTSTSEYHGEILDYSFSFHYPSSWQISQTPTKAIWKIDTNKGSQTMLEVDIFTDHTPLLTEDWIKQKFQLDIDRRQIQWPTIAGITWAIFNTGSTSQPTISQSHAVFNRGEFQVVMTPFRQKILETFSYFHHPLQLGGLEFKPWVNEQPTDSSGWKEFASEAVGVVLKYPPNWTADETTDGDCVLLEYRESVGEKKGPLIGYVSICKRANGNLNDYLNGIGYELTDEAIRAEKVWVYGHRADLLDIFRVNYKGLPGYLVYEIENSRQLFIQKGNSVYEFSRIEQQNKINSIELTIIDNVSFLK